MADHTDEKSRVRLFHWSLPNVFWIKCRVLLMGGDKDRTPQEIIRCFYHVSACTMCV